METNQLVILLIVLAAVAAVAWFWMRRKRSNELRSRFGPEYVSALRDHGDRARAESELEKRAKRVETFHIHPLSPQDRDHFLQDWRRNQAHFVDDPAGAITEADHLVCEVMKARGYPMADFDVRAADLSVDHPHVVRNYRTAHEIALRHGRGQASTEDLRQAMIHYRELVSELLELQPAR